MLKDVMFFFISGNLQRSTLLKHNESKDHKNAVQADHMRQQLYGTDPEVEKEEPIIHISESTCTMID